MTADVADMELKAKHRVMWGNGDYPLMVDTFLLPIGQRLVEGAQIGEGARPSRPRRHGSCLLAR